MLPFVDIVVDPAVQNVIKSSKYTLFARELANERANVANTEVSR